MRRKPRTIHGGSLGGGGLGSGDSGGGLGDGSGGEGNAVVRSNGSHCGGQAMGWSLTNGTIHEPTLSTSAAEQSSTRIAGPFRLLTL